MQTRDLSILFGALCLCAAAGLALLSQDSYAIELHPEMPDPAAVAPAEPAAGRGSGAVAAEASVGPHDAVAVTAGVRAEDERRVDTAGWTSGIVRGDLQVAVSVLDRIKTITIMVEEARSAVGSDGSFRHPHRQAVPVKMGAGTPTFEVKDIPFSEYPYVVSVYAPGLNGSRRTVTIDANTPLVDDIVLAITPGSPFSVLLRDQDATPYAGLDVRLLPLGEPAGRPRATGTSDNFGSVVFEDVLAGDYQVVVSQAGQQLGDPATITVQPGNRSFQSKVQGQGHVMTIQRGVPLQLLVSDARGYGIADARVTATATDRHKLTVLEATTDGNGKAAFAHLTPGSWQIDVGKDDFQRGSRMVTIKPGQLPESQEMRLVRLR